MNDRIIMPNFTVYEGPADENTPTMAGGKIRNEKGMCAVAKCKQPLGEGSIISFFEGGLVFCPECSRKMYECANDDWSRPPSAAFLEELRERARRLARQCDYTEIRRFVEQLG